MSESTVDRAASALLQARSTRQWISSLPAECRPKDLAEAYSVQNLVLTKLGQLAAWKVGAGSPDALPACAAISEATVFDSNASLAPERFNQIGIEAEIAYRFSHDLPVRDDAYTEHDILTAIGSVHPAIEISDTRFAAWASQDRLSHIADQLNHGALVVGPAIPNWQGMMPASQRTVLTINGMVSTDVIGGNPAGDLIRLLVWLANVGARKLGGIRAGHLVTTGSLTGVVFKSPPLRVEAELVGYGLVRANIGMMP